MASNIGPTEHHLFYGNSNSADITKIWVDLSENGDMTQGTSSVHLVNSALDTPYTIMADFDFGASDPAAYLIHRGATDFSGEQALYWDGSKFLVIINNTPYEIWDKGYPAGGRLVLHWSHEEDPLSSLGYIRHNIRIWDHATGNIVAGQDITLPAFSPAIAGTTISFGAAGVSGINGIGSFYGIGLLQHASSELNVYYDRVASLPTSRDSTAPLIEDPMPSQLRSFGDENSLAGPTHQQASAGSWGNREMLLSPLVNLVFEGGDYIEYFNLANSSWFPMSPDETTNLALPFMWRRPNTEMGNHVVCRMFVEYGDFGDFSGVVTPTLKMWSSNANLTEQTEEEEDEELQYNVVSVTLPARNDLVESTPGQWVEFPALRVAEDDDFNSWFSFSFSMDTQPSASVPYIRIHAVTIDPVNLATAVFFPGFI